jgi:hypothetical protein
MDHAVAVIGHGTIKKAAHLVTTAGWQGTIDSYRLTDYLLCSDDNYLPYTTIIDGSPVLGHNHGNQYTYKDIGAIIVPFAGRMLLDAPYIFGCGNYSGCLNIIENNFLSLPPGQPYIRRTLLTSSRSFKKFVTVHSRDNTYLDLMSRIEMPKFIWLIEYSTPTDFDSNLVQHLIILDATAMNHYHDVFLAIKKDNSLIINQPNLDRYFLANSLEKQYVNNLIKQP